MSNIKIADIKPDKRFKSPVTLDKMFLITVPPCPITKGQLGNLAKWGFKEVQVEEELSVTPIKEPKDPSAAKKISLGETESVDLSEFNVDSDTPSNANIPDKFKTSEAVDDFR